ncbi:ABC-2 type transport system ATP-binding protein [Crossiella equi]|uniref:ABC-2 type transport system ATP-binding protein n=1 Tax=Crossiella equi TaxID=130796 RepID=A0ABS5AKE8_9PSEU|nr:hypothetical protein [Crossiella equi]MBP2476847.1 ABC-2 type transport system ATP-binding protein [Crossiella equi]
MAATLVVEDLALRGVLAGAAFTVTEGEHFTVCGDGVLPLAEVLAGRRRPDSGRVTGATAVLLGAEPALFDRLTCREQLAAVAALHRRTPPDLLARVGLTDRADVREDRLTPAERHRLALACALVAEPSVLVVAGEQPWPEVPLTLVRVTEDPLAAQDADRVLLVHGGRVLALADPAVLVAELAAERRLLDPGGPAPTLADVVTRLRRRTR